jgi:hypothetical protein
LLQPHAGEKITVAGTSSGTAILLVAIALGLNWVLSHAVYLFELLRWTGAAYLIWLGLQAWRHAGRQRSVSIGHHVQRVCRTFVRLIGFSPRNHNFERPASRFLSLQRLGIKRLFDQPQPKPECHDTYNDERHQTRRQKHLEIVMEIKIRRIGAMA